jgi:hypothetical protein
MWVALESQPCSYAAACLSRVPRLLLAAGAIALIIGATNSPPVAAGWIVSPGGSFTAHGGTPELADTRPGTP